MGRKRQIKAEKKTGRGSKGRGSKDRGRGMSGKLVDWLFVESAGEATGGNEMDKV